MRLRSIAVLFAATLVVAGAAQAAPPNHGSGKGNAPHGAASAARAGPAKPVKGGGTGVECPKALACRLVPAAYEQNSADPGDYGNYDLRTGRTTASRCASS